MSDAEPRWLDDRQLDAWLAVAGLIIKLPAALDAQLQRDAGISHFDYLVLAGLSEAPGRTLRMSRLASFANGSLSRLSHVVRRLEERGWVLRAPCPEDGRYTNAYLTDAGFAKVEETAPGHVAEVRRLVVDTLGTDDLDRLGLLAGRILARVEPGTRCPPQV